MGRCFFTSPSPFLRGPRSPTALLSSLHSALQGSPFWKLPQEMHKAARTADLQSISLCRRCMDETRGVGQKAAWETNEHLRNPVGLVVRAGAQHPHSATHTQPVATDLQPSPGNGDKSAGSSLSELP